MNIRIFFTVLGLLSALCIWSQQTERRYLSGTGLGDGVTWQFYCSEGRNSGKWSKIEVPSQWELQGFGEYTYGRWYKKKGVKNPSIMTDTDVIVNGVSAGETHLQDSQ